MELKLLKRKIYDFPHFQTKLWVFPEGARFNKGTIQPFKKGAFYLAIDAQIPILPVVFSQYYFLDSGSKTFEPGTYEFCSVSLWYPNTLWVLYKLKTWFLSQHNWVTDSAHRRLDTRCSIIFKQWFSLMTIMSKLKGCRKQNNIELLAHLYLSAL